MAYLSLRQQKELERRRAPIKHAMERLQERHFPELDDDGAEHFILAMTLLCEGRNRLGDTNSAKLVNIESENSHIVDLDMFEDRKLIRVRYDPVANRIKTVFPQQN